MDNKSILEAARNNGDRGNEYEMKENIRSSMISTVAMLVVGMFLLDTEVFFIGHNNFTWIKSKVII